LSEAGSLQSVGCSRCNWPTASKKKSEKITMAIGKARKNPKTTTAASNYFELRLIGGKWSQLATSWPAAPLIVAQLYCQL